jgi:hypothetical protein
MFTVYPGYLDNHFMNRLSAHPYMDPVPISSMTIFQTSCEHVLVTLTVITWRAFSNMYLALIVAMVFLLLQTKNKQ